MAKGIALPAKTINGRLQMLGGDDYISQLVMTMLGRSDSDNPFQDIGLGDWMIFDINDRMTEGEIRERVVAGFKSLEVDQLARLDNPQKDITFIRVDGTGELYMDLVYENMETQERVELEVAIPPG